MKECTTALVGRLDWNSRRGALALMPPGFGTYLPLPRGDGLAAEKGFLVRDWAQGRDGPE